MYQIVDLAKHKILALFLKLVYCGSPPPGTCINISLDFIFRFSGKSSQMQVTLLETILSFYQLNLSLNNEEEGQTCPWNCQATVQLFFILCK